MVFEGRFDQPRVSSYAASFGGTMKHYDAGDLYEFRVKSAPETTSMMFLGPNRLAFAVGRDAHTQILMLADAAKTADPNLHADICARAERVAGASFFLLGDVPKTAVAQITLPLRVKTQSLPISCKACAAGTWRTGWTETA